MAKIIGKATVIKTDEYSRKDGTKGIRVTAFTDEGEVTVFYRPFEEQPVKDTVYNMVLGFDNRLSAVVRYQLAK